MTLDEIEEGCRRVLGHGESCVKEHLCESCIQLCEAYTFQSNITAAVTVLRKREALWRTTNNKKAKLLQHTLDLLCSFIEDEMP